MLFKEICTSQRRQRELDSQIQLTVSMPSMANIGQQQQQDQKVRRSQSHKEESQKQLIDSWQNTCFSNDNIQRGIIRSPLLRGLRALGRCNRALHLRAQSLDRCQEISQITRGLFRSKFPRRRLNSMNHRRYAPQRPTTEKNTQSVTVVTDSDCGESPLANVSTEPSVLTVEEKSCQSGVTNSSSREILEPVSIFAMNGELCTKRLPSEDEKSATEKAASEANSDEMSMGFRVNRFLLADALSRRDNAPLYASINKQAEQNGQASIYEFIRKERHSSPIESTNNGSGSYEGVGPPTPPIRKESSLPRASNKVTLSHKWRCV
ncbi:hypothetical protein Ciccas_011400 [Cichlidogyrus casuarinus]|uniref:Uncharacterized protein n=1 Tax=Cichlidogyrus casuarinus TaxID=1844966 RepID=A0ABD2PW51_9PLAT